MAFMGEVPTVRLERRLRSRGRGGTGTCVGACAVASTGARASTIGESYESVACGRSAGVGVSSRSMSTSMSSGIGRGEEGVAGEGSS